MIFFSFINQLINISSRSQYIVNVHSSTPISMYNKCCCAYVLLKRRRRLRQVTSSPLLSNHIIPLQLTQPSYHIIVITGSCYQHKIEANRRCNCRPMILLRRMFQRQTLTDDMLVNINNHVTSNNIHINHVYF